MNTRSANFMLLGINLGLMGVVACLAYLLLKQPTLPSHEAQALVVTNTVKQIAVRKVNATNWLAGLAGRPLSWGSLESTNYFAYIANLRNFGCPEETIRDIILTDVAKLYARRRAALRAQLPPPKFWQTGNGRESGASNPEILRQLRDLDEEQRDLIRQLLGVDFNAEMARYWNEEEPLPPQYDFLPEAKRSQVTQLLSHYDQLEADLFERAKGLLLDSDEKDLKTLQRQREEALSTLLTPEELEEYQLRNSPTAYNLRAQLDGFNASEEEFRKVFQVQKAYDDAFNQPFDPDDDRDAQIRAKAQTEAQQALNDELKKALGDDRFKEYQRSTDTDYRTLAQLTERFGLAKEVASKVYEMKLEAEQQRQRIESNPDLAYEQRQRALQAIQKETEKTVSETLGETHYRDYRKSGGLWMRNLGITETPPPPAAENPLPPPPVFNPNFFPPPPFPR